MSKPSYSLSWILPFVRKVIKDSGNLKYDTFMQNLWMRLEQTGVVKRLDQHQQMVLRRTFDFGNDPHDLRLAANEAFFYLVRNGYIVPQVSSDFPLNQPPRHTYDVTSRGKEWANGDDPLPEDSAGYMNHLKGRVPTTDAVIEEYVRNALIAFNGGAFFAAAVMIGAASEKTLYMLADAMLPAFKAPGRKQKLEQLFLHKRSLVHFLEFIRDTLQKNAKTIDPSDGAITQIAGMFDAIRVQRNEAVHPEFGQVSSESVRFTMVNFPSFLAKSEEIRDWLSKHGQSLD